MEGSLARALYTFQASQPGELTVQEGDVIRVTQYIDNHWLEAEHQGQTGLFPVTYAKRLEDEAPQGKLTSVSTSEQDLERSVIEQWTYSAMEGSGQATEKLSNYNESNDGSLVEAAFAFGARNDSELTFPAGAWIELARDVDDDWLEGSFNGKTGLFPKSYVKASSQKPCARAVYPFVGESQGELTFREGEYIYLRKRLNSQWMEGELDGNVGLFPSSFVAVEVDLPPDDSVFVNGDFLISDSTPKHADWGNTAASKIQWKKGMKGKALFHFTALYSGDLELNEGDVVTILQAEDDNWIEGQLPNGISGSCPAAYLEPISNDKTSPLHSKQPAPNTGTQAFNARNFTSVSLSDFSSDTGYSKNLQLTGSRNSKHDAELSSDDFLSSSQGSDFVDSWDPRNLLDSSLNSDDFTPVLLPSDTTSQFSMARPNSPLPTAKPLLKPKPALKPKPNEKCSVTYLGSESRNVGSSVEKSRTFPRPATSMPSLVSDVTASTTNSLVSASRVDANVRRAPRDTVQTELNSVRSSQSSSSSGYHYESTGTWPGKRGGIHKDTAVSSGKERSLNVMDKNDLLSGSCTSLPSPLVPLPRGGREDSRQSDSSEDSPVTPKRPAPSPPKKGSAGNNHVRSSTLPAPRTRNPVQNISSKEISPSKPRSRRQADGRILKADVEERTVKQRASSPHSNTRDSSLSPKGSPKSSGRISVNKPKTLPRPTSVYWGERDTGTMNSKGPLELKRSSSLEQLSTVKTSSNLAVADSAIFSHSDVQLDADNSEDSEEIGEVPGLAKLEERIADTEQNMKREMKVFTGMKTISQLVMTDPVKQQEMDAKVSRSQQKITEWQGELKHLKDEQAFLIESHRKKVLKITIADLESDLEKQVRSQRSLETLLGVVEENRKGEVMDNLGTCAQLVENIKIKLTELEASLHSLTEKPAASSQKHMAEQRQRVLTELINTEKDYCKDLELCVKHFLLELRLTQIKELDCESLFGNIENVLDTSRKLLQSLEDAVQDKEGKDQELGKCFVDIAEEMKEVYAVYCRNHDDAISLMEKYEEMSEVQDVLTRCLDKIREHTRCWDLSSFLIKPVQRVLKYPLLLNELLKYTPEIHRDKYNLLRAISVMTDVANAINEFKRRKDLVVKYKKVEDSGLTNMIQKLSWHSVVKKSSRFNQRLTQLTGLVSQTIDEKFIEEEKKFRSMEKTVKTLEKNILMYLDECQENAVCQQMSAENISDFYQEAATCSEVSTYHKVQNMVGETILIRFMDGVQQQVLSPLTALLNLFQGPQRLIQKRNDKCLDYDRWSNKIDKIKDRDKLKAAKDELELAKKNYEALNTQLLEEIPGFTKKCMALVVDCLENFSLAQSRLYFEIQQEYEQLLQLPVVQTRDADIVEHHTKRSVQVVEHFSDLSFIPCSFVAKDSSRKKRKSHKQPALPSLDPNALEDNNNSSKTDPPDTTEGELVGTSKKGPAPAPPSQQMLGDHLRPRPAPRRLSSNNRSESHDTDNPQLVEVTPGEGKVHIVEFNFEAQNVGELSVTEGVLVSVLRHCDTSGNPEWWLVHCNGSTGYVPESFLSPVDSKDEDTVFDEDKDTAIDDHVDEKASEEEIVVSSDKATPVLYYYAEFVFEASSSAELSLDEGQVVVVVQKQDLLGNDEWWLVDADGEKGYVPASYLTPVEE